MPISACINPGGFRRPPQMTIATLATDIPKPAAEPPKPAFESPMTPPVSAPKPTDSSNTATHRDRGGHHDVRHRFDHQVHRPPTPRRRPAPDDQQCRSGDRDLPQHQRAASRPACTWDQADAAPQGVGDTDRQVRQNRGQSSVCRSCCRDASGLEMSGTAVRAAAPRRPTRTPTVWTPRQVVKHRVAMPGWCEEQALRSKRQAEASAVFAAGPVAWRKPSLPKAPS